MLQIDEIGNVHDRIAEMVDFFCRGNKAAFGRKADIQSGVLAGIIAGRKNKPSFDVLQKLLTGYPSVNPTWLIFGHGPMIKEGNETPVEPTGWTGTQDDVGALFTSLIANFMDSNSLNPPEWYLSEFIDHEKKYPITQVYTVADKSKDKEERVTLSQRLKVSDKEAEALVLTEKILASHLGPTRGYLITEKTVREHLAATSTKETDPA